MTTVSEVRRRTAYKWILFLVCVTMFIPLALWVRETGFAAAPAEAAPARKFSEADMDAAFLLRLQDRLVAAQALRAREALRAEGYSEDMAPAQVSSTYVTSNGHRYGLVRSRLRKDESEVEALLIVGLAEGELRRVVCTSSQGEVPVGTGPCAQKIGETFGTVL